MATRTTITTTLTPTTTTRPTRTRTRTSTTTTLTTTTVTTTTPRPTRTRTRTTTTTKLTTTTVTTTTPPPTTTTTVLQALQWVTGGTDTVCRINENDDTTDGQGTVSVSYTASLDDCKASCEAQVTCTGIEFQASNGRCVIWTLDIGFMISVSGYECVRLRRSTQARV